MGPTVEMPDAREAAELDRASGGANVLVQGGVHAEISEPVDTSALGFDEVRAVPTPTADRGAEPRREDAREERPQSTQPEEPAQQRNRAVEPPRPDVAEEPPPPPMVHDGVEFAPRELAAPPLRRSQRTNIEKKPEWNHKAAYHASLVGHCNSTSTGGSYVLYAYRTSVKQAWADPDLVRRASALKAVQSEIKQLVIMKAVKPVMRKDITTYEWNHRVYPSHIFIKDKYLANGDFERIKARLMAGGNYVEPEGTVEVSSPTVNPLTVMMMINIATVMEISCHGIKRRF
jgi:hypothetical protein